MLQAQQVALAIDENGQVPHIALYAVHFEANWLQVLHGQACNSVVIQHVLLLQLLLYALQRLDYDVLEGLLVELLRVMVRIVVVLFLHAFMLLSVVVRLLKCSFLLRTVKLLFESLQLMGQSVSTETCDQLLHFHGKALGGLGEGFHVERSRLAVSRRDGVDDRGEELKVTVSIASQLVYVQGASLEQLDDDRVADQAPSRGLRVDELRVGDEDLVLTHDYP